MLKNLKIYVGVFDRPKEEGPSRSVSKTSSYTSEKFSSLKRNDPKIKELE